MKNMKDILSTAARIDAGYNLVQGWVSFKRIDYVVSEIAAAEIRAGLYDIYDDDDDDDDDDNSNMLARLKNMLSISDETLQR